MKSGVQPIWEDERAWTNGGHAHVALPRSTLIEHAPRKVMAAPPKRRRANEGRARVHRARGP